MLAWLILIAALAPPPPPPPGTPPTTIADLVRIEGKCSLSVIIVGDDGLSSRFNDAVITAVRKRERAFCDKANGNYVIYTNSNVRPTDRSLNYFSYNLTGHEARNYIARHDTGDYETLGTVVNECRDNIPTCADHGVSKLLDKLRGR